MAGYIGSKASVVSSGAERKKTFDITGTTASLTGLSYTVNQVHVFHNGVRLVDGTDFTATNGSSITLTSAAESGDEVVVISYAGYQVSDTVSASQGGTFSGDVTMSGNLNTTDVLPSTDSTSDLGSTSKRFQDLYLSGGVYLGGTGSANKMSDYETGTWTPIYYDANAATELAGVVYNSRRYGKYTKVGNLVTVYFQIITDTMTLTGAAGNDVWLSGLPFSVGTLSDSDGNSDIGAYVAASPNTFNDIPIRVEASAGYTGFILRTSTGTFEINDMQTGSFDNNLQGSITYPTNS